MEGGADGGTTGWEFPFVEGIRSYAKGVLWRLQDENMGVGDAEEAGAAKGKKGKENYENCSNVNGGPTGCPLRERSGLEFSFKNELGPAFLENSCQIIGVGSRMQVGPSAHVLSGMCAASM